MIYRSILLTLLICSYSLSYAQSVDRAIDFPDVDGYLTLKCDFHIHTVFSDGLVWPTIRIDEAVKDGLDAISLTEHLEYQPHADDIPHPDRNRSYEIAKQAATAHDIIVIHGAEITRDMPPGHANALFITDANKLSKEEPIDAYRAAREQGAYIFWNHPNWMAQQKDAIPVLSEFHQELIAEDLLHGIEVVNDITFSMEALAIAQANDLGIIGTSDIHGLVDYQFALSEGGHRPIMLVLAKERTEESIKEALFARRTIAWFKDLLIGDTEHLTALIDASVEIKNQGYIGDTEILQLQLTNRSDASFYFKNQSPYTFYDDGQILTLSPQGTLKLQVLTARADINSVPLTLSVLNAVNGYQSELEWEIPLVSN